MTDYQDRIEAEMDRQLRKLAQLSAVARQENDWATWNAISHRADGVRDALEGVRRLYLEQMQVAP
jgi:hypothetical protein